jgi:hypothetical protein
MKSSILRSGLALACALGLAACGGGKGDLPLSGQIQYRTKDGLQLPNAKEGLVLQNNGGNDLVVPAGATVFQFSNNVSTDDEFNITVKSKPSNVEKCDVINAKARANYYTINQVGVLCYLKTHPLKVTVNGLTADNLVLVNGSDSKTVTPGTPNPVQMEPVTEDSAYGVTILQQQPVKQVCTVVNGSGIMGATDAGAEVTVNCAASGS